MVVMSQVADLHPSPKRQLINGVTKYLLRQVPKTQFKHHIQLRQLIALGRVLGVPDHKAQPSDVAVLQYTGGTTGVAKGVMLTHANLLACMQQCAMIYDRANWVAGEMVLIVPLPLYHIYAFSVSLMHGLNNGHNSVLIPNPRDTKRLIRTLKKTPSDGFIGLNTLFNALLNQQDFCDLDFSRMRLTLSGGMALSKPIADRWKAVTGVEILEGYGLTESSGILSVNVPGEAVLGTVGICFSSSEFKIAGENDEALGVDQDGEVRFRGPQAMKGYWNHAEATAEMIDPQRWYKTGDIGRVGSDGLLRIVDRKKDMIIVSGFKVFPNEIEDYVISHPDIVECAAVAGEGEYGEFVRLFVVSKNPDLTEQAVRDFCRKALTAYKVPKQVVFKSELPKSNIGKILRKELRE